MKPPPSHTAPRSSSPFKINSGSATVSLACSLTSCYPSKGFFFLAEDETIYCELVQWSDDCRSGECTILAQYLGALNDVLFPPNMCSNEGVDLLMRRSKDFPVSNETVSCKIFFALTVFFQILNKQLLTIKKIWGPSGCRCKF